MKRILALMLALIMLFGFTGCAEESGDEATKSIITKTITASNGDKIKIKLTDGDSPSVLVTVNDKEICSFDNFAKYKDAYDFDKDFTLNATKEYSDTQILWAYKFDWGVIYSTKYTLTGEETEATITYAALKHDYDKSYFNKINFEDVAQKWDLVDFEIIPETGKKIFWENYPAAQAVFEYIYKTENYTIKEIDDLEKAGYSFSEKKYYYMHDLEFSSGAGLNDWQKIYEISVDGKPFALMFCQSYSWHYILQELDWKGPCPVSWKRTENGMEYEATTRNGDKLTDIS
ncbi:MAG: hypothetical protein IKT42_01270 [Clostridia bacterium]|nr:hypothetical protein [Clostridia bacterium]